MVRTDAGSDGLDLRQASKDAFAGGRMPLDGFELGLGQSPGLLEHGIWHTDLADIVEPPADGRFIDGLFIASGVDRQPSREIGHAVAVTTGARILCLDSFKQCPGDAAERHQLGQHGRVIHRMETQRSCRSVSRTVQLRRVPCPAPSVIRDHPAAFRAACVGDLHAESFHHLGRGIFNRVRAS